MYWSAVGVLRRDRRRASPAPRPCSASLVLISPEMKYFCAQRLEQLVQALALLRHQLEDQQRRDEAVVGVEVVAEVVVAGDLAAEDARWSRASAA